MSPNANVTQSLKAAATTLKVDGIWIPSSDAHLSEYNGGTNNLREVLTGFTGSMGDAVYVLSQNQIHLAIDGRYHLQADRECGNRSEIVLHKADSAADIIPFLRRELEKQSCRTIGVPASRLSAALYLDLEKSGFKLAPISESQLLSFFGPIGFEGPKHVFQIRTVPEIFVGVSLAKQLQKFRTAIAAATGGKSYLYHTNASDDAAYLLVSRSYAIPCQSSFLASVFLTSEKVFVLFDSTANVLSVPDDWAACGVEYFADEQKFLEQLRQQSADVIVSHPAFMNSYWPKKIADLFPKAIAQEWTGLMEWRARKNPQEQAAFRDSFLRSSRAIAKTLRWAMDASANGVISERDLANKIDTEYRAEGAVGLSFRTIAGFAENSAVVHYGACSPDVKSRPGDLVLLDSGAYYDAGFATDCTRGFVVRGAAPQDWQKKIYTTCLKSAIQVFLKPVMKAWNGREVDAFVRTPILAAGWNYLHGTGHGVGILVHEEGVRFSPASNYAQKDTAVVSVEPGIYLTGQGGVRVENVVILHEQDQAFEYENLVFVGYDWNLVDVDALTENEKNHLRLYERRCRELGTAITDCPLGL